MPGLEKTALLLQQRETPINIQYTDTVAARSQRGSRLYARKSVQTRWHGQTQPQLIEPMYRSFDLQLYHAGIL